MPRRIDETGNKYGRLLVISEHGKRKDGKICWLCKCICGNEAIVSGKSLRMGSTKSCGCLHKENKNLPDNTRPFGYKRMTSKGYIVIKTHNGFMFEHIYEMEKSLGRKLVDDERVHHIDHDKTNNNIANLELIRHGEHTRLHHIGMKMSKEACRMISKAKIEATKRRGHIGRKLTKNDVVNIRNFYTPKVLGYMKIAKIYDITPAMVRNIVKRLSWRYV